MICKVQETGGRDEGEKGRGTGTYAVQTGPESGFGRGWNGGRRGLEEGGNRSLGEASNVAYASISENVYK